jgi:hypothetical protein
MSESMARSSEFCSAVLRGSSGCPVRGSSITTGAAVLSASRVVLEEYSGAGDRAGGDLRIGAVVIGGKCVRHGADIIRAPRLAIQLLDRQRDTHAWNKKESVRATKLLSLSARAGLTSLQQN